MYNHSLLFSYVFFLISRIILRKVNYRRIYLLSNFKIFIQLSIIYCILRVKVQKRCYDKKSNEN